MALPQMAPGGQWFMPPFAEGVPVYVPKKQLEAHRRRLVAEDGWTPIADPRKEGDQVTTPVIPIEVAMQARIDQLEALVQQLLAQKSEQDHASQKHDGSTDSKGPADDKRSSRGKPAV